MRIPLTASTRAWAMGATLLLAACGGGSTDTPATPTLSTIALSPNTASLVIGATQTLSVLASYSDGSTATLTSGVSFTSGTSSVASVSSAGVVTAVAAGSATITASSSGKTATATITVTAPAPTLTSIAITPTAISLAPAATRQLTITGTYSDASTAALATGVTFASSSASVATVNSSGLITAVAAGTTTITATHTASTRTANVTVTVTAPAGGPVVFFDEYNGGVSFADFGGATNAVTVDATTLHNGRKTLRAVVTGSGGYSGGAFVSATPRNLSAYNALTFWAKASVAKSSLKVGIGNNAANANFNAESIGIPLTTTFTKFTIPLPNPSKYVDITGLFHFADGPNNYTIWFSDIQYETLPTSQVAAPTEATVGWPTLTIAIGSPQQIAPAPNTVRFTTPALPNGGILSDVAWRWYTLTSSNPAVATVSADGLVTGVSAGTANITATMNGLTIPAFAPV
ncbi:MAG: Ig-like domain-containing protein, partial [Gemmatimonadaceae bacterium]|nr:Ig-like domain-containing protein [Gemmatimonadaceae bacterium]